MHVHDDEKTAGTGGEVCADLTGRLPMAHNGSEYLMVALRRETRFGFVKAFVVKQTQRDSQRSEGHAVAVAWSSAFPQR